MIDRVDACRAESGTGSVWLCEETELRRIHWDLPWSGTQRGLRAELASWCHRKFSAAGSGGDETQPQSLRVTAER